MRVNKIYTKAAVLVIYIGTAMGSMADEGQAPAYRILSKTQVLVNVGCLKGCTAKVVTPETSGKAEPVVTDGQPNPDWTLVTVTGGGFQFESKSQYILAIGHNEAAGTSDVVVIDTTPKAKFAAKAAGPRSLNLTSNVAFAVPGRLRPLFSSVGTCPNGDQPIHLDVELLYPGIEADFRKTGLCEVDMGKLPALNPNAVGVIQGIFTVKESTKSNGLPKAPAQIGGVVSVLGDTFKVPDAPKLSKAKVPDTELAAWLWINGTVTAGTGTAPAWVLDGKLAPLQTQPRGTTKWTWVQATADVGNNKINGVTAKDVVDFAGPAPTNYQDWKSLGAEFTVAPTYETDRELDHKNFLAAGGAQWDWGKLNQNQFVRTARAHDPAKMPEAGDYKGGYDPYGWDLHFHTGFEAGGALAATTVTNPKTKALIGTIPTYSIGRFVSEIDGIVQLYWFSFESDFTGRYLFTTEHTAVNNKAGIPYLETVLGWKAVNVGTVTITPGDQHFGVTVAYTNGFAAPSYQRADCVKFGVQVKY
jgi:hypothetical protein